MFNCRMTRCPHPPRLVELTKWENFPGYGFNLHAEKTRQGEISEMINCPARALRALGLLLADGTPTGGRGEDFLTGQPDFFTETAVTPERKVEKSFPRWEINRHDKG